jgi:hypothetical protein
MKRAGIALAAALGVLCISASSAAAADCSVIQDTFNRPDSASLGGNWTQQAPTMSIAGQRATNPNNTTGLATFNGLTGNAACADVTDGAGSPNYVALVLSYATGADNLFIKVQDNIAPAGFDRAYFYHGNNGPQFAPSQAIANFTTGRMSVARVGDNVTLEVDTNADGIPEQAFTASGANAVPNLGTGLGLGIYGKAFADNFATPATPPTVSPVVNVFSIGNVTKNKRKGTATIPVTVPGPGSLALSGNGIKAGGATATAGSTVKLVVRAKGKKKRKLSDTGKVVVNPTITYSPTGGTPNSQTLKVKLKQI